MNEKDIKELKDILSRATNLVAVDTESQVTVKMWAVIGVFLTIMGWIALTVYDHSSRLTKLEKTDEFTLIQVNENKAKYDQILIKLDDIRNSQIKRYGEKG